MDSLKSVIVAKASSAWWSLTSVTDRQRLHALTRRGVRSELCDNGGVSSVAELVDSMPMKISSFIAEFELMVT